MNPALQMILIQFKPCDLGILRIFKYLGCKIGALFNRVIVTPFTLTFLMNASSSFLKTQYYDSDDSGEEEYDKLGSESGSFCTCGTGLGGLLHDIEFTVGVTLAGYDGPFDGGGG